MGTVIEQVAPTEASEQILPFHCDCVHERMTDGIHHYLSLPGSTDESSPNFRLDESLSRGSEPYIAVAYAEGDYCFMQPRWAATFRGPSEAGEIPPSFRLLCDWCKNHWSQAPQVSFRKC